MGAGRVERAARRRAAGERSQREPAQTRRASPRAAARRALLPPIGGREAPPEQRMRFFHTELAPARMHGSGQPFAITPGCPPPVSARRALPRSLQRPQPLAPRPPPHTGGEPPLLLAPAEPPLPLLEAASLHRELNDFERRHGQGDDACTPGEVGPDFSLQDFARQLRCAGDVKLIDRVPRMVSTLFSLQVGSNSGIMARLSETSPEVVKAHLMSAASQSAGWLTRRQTKEVVRTILGPPPPHAWEEDMLFDMFDIDESETLDVREFLVGLQLLRRSKDAELLMHKVHHILSLVQRRPLSIQFVTRFEAQLLCEAAVRFWESREGAAVAEQCRQCLDANLMCALNWTDFSGRLPAEQMRAAILRDPELANWFMCHAVMQEAPATPGARGPRAISPLAADFGAKRRSTKRKSAADAASAAEYRRDRRGRMVRCPQPGTRHVAPPPPPPPVAAAVTVLPPLTTGRRTVC
eukprot:TRINITY_DN26913_c0_g1_i1.p1 TRINITY_DN26913_c0_g1~~TRINITY_DN26913_c0_g1_i1.p1  ORF type:complete len:486 (+),score=122.57 TRINITY_DN26913_c0_g1_i1:59-1459(+)